jgi:hypothetical protein
MTTHNVVYDTFASIAKGTTFHVLHEHIHGLSLPSLKFLSQWVDIMLTTYGAHTLIDFIIVNPIQTYLVLWFVVSWGVVAMIAT